MFCCRRTKADDARTRVDKSPAPKRKSKAEAGNGVPWGKF
jgi:hypothetical protein